MNPRAPYKSGVYFPDEQQINSTTLEAYRAVEKFFGEKTSNSRFYNFTWLSLTLNEGQNFPEESLGHKEHTINDINYFLRNTYSDRLFKDYAYEIRKKFNRHAISPENLAWLEHSPRAVKWIKEKIIKLDQDKVSWFPNLTGLPLIQAVLDYWDERLSTKKLLIANLEKRWLTHIKTDVQLNWLEQQPNAEVHRRLAWNELCLHYHDKFNFDRTPNSQKDILDIFDQLEEHEISKKDFIKRLKNKLNKQKSADNGKKPKNLEILLSNHKKLKALAKHWSSTESNAMDRIISEAFDLTFPSEGKRPTRD